MAHFNDLGIEVLLKEDDDFLKIIETLTRIGMPSGDSTVTQTCHILHRQGHYAILHFKELLKLDGVGRTEMSEEDTLRRNAVVKLLKDWNLCTESVDSDRPFSLKGVKVVPFRDKSKYTLKQNYTIGPKK